MTGPVSRITRAMRLRRRREAAWLWRLAGAMALLVASAGAAILAEAPL